MTPDLAAAEVYTDFAGLARLRGQARKDSPETLRAVALQFEALFMQMVLKSMREASLGDDLFDNDQSRFYRGMFDQQLATTLAGKGRGLGLAETIIRQLGGGSGAPTPEPGEGRANFSPPGRSTQGNAAFPVLGGQSRAASEEWRASESVPGATDTLTIARRRGGGEVSSTSQAPRYADHGSPITVPGPRPPAPEFDGTPETFVRTLWPHARQAGRDLGVSPEVLLAQAALETGWGGAVIRHPGGRSSHNLFGIKAGGGWPGERVEVSSPEYVNGLPVRQRSAFRSYGSFAQSFADYVDLLRTSPRYAGALRRGDDPAAFSEALQAAGYATDPAYARKIKAILAGDALGGALASVKFAAGKPLS